MFLQEKKKIPKLIVVMDRLSVNSLKGTELQTLNR